MMRNEYRKLMDIMDEMVMSGCNALDPVVRSIGRKASKLYKRLSDEEKRLEDYEDMIWFS